MSTRYNLLPKATAASTTTASPRSPPSLIKAAADTLEAESKHGDEQSDEPMHQHHHWAQATTALQVSMAMVMATIALLANQKWLEAVMSIAGAVWIG